MHHVQRVAFYFQRLAYDMLFQHVDRDELPSDASPQVITPNPNYPVWNATSFADYQPFRAPQNE